MFSTYRFNQILCGGVLVAVAMPARASMTLLGSSSCSHVGNLVTNGSFEIGGPAPGSANWVYWATGTTSLPFAVPPGWSSSGSGNNYAVWGSDGPPQLKGSDTLPDGQSGLYFGNYAGAQSSLPPTFNTNGTVTFQGTPTMTAPKGNPVKLWQSVPTNTNLAPNYCFSFWVSGEFAGQSPGGVADGIFGLRVTNVLAGDPLQFLTVPGGTSGLGASHRYDFDLVPINPLLPIDIEFWNWGHFDLTPWGGPGFTSELVMDDVMINAMPEPASLGLLALGNIALLRKSRKIEKSKKRNHPMASRRVYFCAPRGNASGYLLLLALIAGLSVNRSARASMTQNLGPQIAVHPGNLVTNGSFETGAPAPGFANQLYWATGTTNTPFSVPPGWTSSGQPQTYALWGSDAPAAGIEFSDVIPDGQAGLYFGNASTSVTPAPSFGPNHNVTFSSPPTFTPFYGGPCTLSQTINTPATPAPSYVLNFWVSGEDASINGFMQQGVFGLKVTNVLPGDPIQYFAVPNAASLPSYRLEFFFSPINSSSPVTIEFINWGHITTTPGSVSPFDSTELVLDDVIINAVPEPASLLLAAAGGLLLFKRPGLFRKTTTAFNAW